MHVFHAFGKPQGRGERAVRLKQLGPMAIIQVALKYYNVSSYKDFTTKIHKTRVDPVLSLVESLADSH